jgi:hypothetical protein
MNYLLLEAITAALFVTLAAQPVCVWLIAK